MKKLKTAYIKLKVTEVRMLGADIEFDEELETAYIKAKMLEARALEAMKRNLIVRNGGSIVVIDTLTKGSSISIDTANIAELYMADEILAARKTSKDPDRMV